MQHHRRGVSVSALALRARRVEWPLREPFVIARETQTSVPCIEVALMDGDGTQGRGEAAGVDYAGETPETMLAQIDAVRTNLKTELSHHELAALLPAGGARNALDCALWDLRAKQQRTSVLAPDEFSAPKGGDHRVHSRPDG